jgi:hypothetical protein
MSRAFDEHNWRDVGGPENLHVRELSPAEREKAEKRRTQEMAEAYKKSVAARRETEERSEAMFEGALSQAPDILTPRRVHEKQQAELAAARRVYDAQKEWQREDARPDADGVTPEEHAEMERWLAGEDDE